MTMQDYLNFYGCLACSYPLMGHKHTCGKDSAVVDYYQIDFMKEWEDCFKKMNSNDGIRAWEAGDTIFVEFDLPGSLVEGIKLQVDDKAITVTTESRKWGVGTKWLYGSGPVGTTKTFSLKTIYDPNSASATYENGVLRVSLSKKISKKTPDYVKITPV